MHYFDRRSYDFAHTFGFSMYDGRAESNADILLLHFYCMMDEEGNFMVSSWGENYILRKADIMGKRYFIRVRYIL